MKIVDITSEPIQLYKILKFEGLVSNGGEAKAAVAEGLVRVNGQTETRKRKQIVSGDIVEFRDEKMRIRLI
jgi:ribosome-associated protein